MSASHEAIPEPDRGALRSFGLLMGGMIAALFGLLFPWFLGRPFPLWPWIVLAVFLALGLAVPMALRHVYRVWMRFGLLMGRVTTPIILGIVFFLLITPLSLVMRLGGWDSLRRRLDRHGADSYRQPSQAKPPAQLERPF